MTMWTDYALGTLAIAWSAMLIAKARGIGRKSVALWGIGFAGLALGSFAAGTYHGFSSLAPSTLVKLWSFVTWTMGLASFAMFSGAVLALSSGAWRSLLLATALLKAIAFAIWAAGRDQYAFVLLDYGSAQLAILVLALIAWRNERAACAPPLLAGILVSAIGAAVQQSDLSLHRSFDHNDLYHAITMLGLYLLYRGGARFTDRGAQRDGTRI
jgi:hypothetical protein